MNPHLAAAQQPTPSIYREQNFRQRHQEFSDAIYRNDKDYLRSHVRKPAMGGAVNLSEDPLLNVLIAYGKSCLAIELLEEISEDDLMCKNYKGDTALHVAVMEGDEKVATALIERKKDLLHARNKHLESPLHKAALYGERKIFWLLENGGDCCPRRENGDTVLLCAIMGNAPLFARVEFLHQLKTNHKEAMKLVEYLARDPEYWDFVVKGRTGSMPPLPKPDEVKHTREMMNASTGDTRAQSEARADESKRWDESPLTLGAKMGLHEFVERILKVYPQSAMYLDSEGKNILQVAIQNGQEKIVGIVELMATGPNAVLPSWLLSSIDKNTKNTILHFAAETTRKENAVALQMQTELQWFEKVRKLVPKELEYSRNDKEKTAQELFTENHKEMVKDAKIQLVKIGETGSGLATGVIFALSSFSFPDDKEEKAVFKAFSHAYVISLTSAATALVLFMALRASTYNEQDFRKSLPAKHFFANASYYLSLAALLVAFSCNIYIKIYGGGNQEAKHIVPLVGELAIFPVVCFFLLLYSYAWLYKART